MNKSLLNKSLILIIFLLISIPKIGLSQCLVQVNSNGFEYNVALDLEITDVIYTQSGTTCNIQIEVTYDIQIEVINKPSWWNGTLYNLSGNLDCAGASGMSAFDLPEAGGSNTVLSATFSMNGQDCGDVVLDCPMIITISGPELNETISCGTYMKTTLPISLLSFDYDEIENKRIKVKWGTQSETNFSHFELQQSTEFNNWETVGSVDGLNAINGASYQYIIPSEFHNTYLRLKVIDFDNQFEYSEVLFIPAEVSANLTAYPNPAADRIYIPGIDVEKVIIINTFGQEVSLHVESDQSINVESLVPGYYFVKVGESNGLVQTIRLVKQ